MENKYPDAFLCKEMEELFMDFWLLNIKSTVVVNGKDVAFDYINTYFEPNEAINEAKLFS